MSSLCINSKWGLKETFKCMRRFLTTEVNQYTINRVRIELNYALETLNNLEKELIKEFQNDRIN